MPKLLSDFLQEQQEPFALDVYLLERGHSLNAGRRRRAIPNCSRFVKAVLSSLVFHNNHQFKIVNNRGPKNTQEHADVDEFSSESGATQYSSCSETDSSENGERKLKMERESNKQLSPVSVLEETESDQESPLHQKQHNFKTTQLGESSTSTPQRKSTHQEHADSNSQADQYAINKRLLQQRKQLLIDCVREVIESHRRKDDKNGEQLKKILGADELWKIVCENVWLWSQDSIDQTNVVRLLHSDFMASAAEWDSGFEQHKEEMIFMVIGDAILDDIVNEIVMS